MRVLVADDDAATRKLLEAHLLRWGYDPVMAKDGDEAWEALQRPDGPRLAVLDWLMPAPDGIEICRRVRANPGLGACHLIVLSNKTQKEDVVEGLDHGADDFITKPFHPEELRARLRMGARLVSLQDDLAARVKELEAALASVNQLQGLLPICSYCKKIRDDKDYWHQVESYVARRSEAKFSHGVCPDCYERVVRPQVRALEVEMKDGPASPGSGGGGPR